jgi:hypothetical protein
VNLILVSPPDYCQSELPKTTWQLPQEKNTISIHKKTRWKMSVFEKVTREIRAGMVFHTPVRNASFTIDSIDAKHVVFFVGAKTRIKIPRACWDGIPHFLRGKGWVEIGGKHDVAPSGTFEEYLDQYWSEGKSHASGASYVVPVLEHLELVEVDHRIPSRIRLR